MDFNTDKIDEYTLALLYLVSFRDQFEMRAWKSFDWDTMDRLHAKGFISDPKSKAKSICLTPEGEEEMKRLFSKYFGMSSIVA